MQSNAIAMQCNAIACDCNAIQSDCNAMRLRCNAIAMQCDCNAMRLQQQNSFCGGIQVDRGPRGDQGKKKSAWRRAQPSQTEEALKKKCERFLRRKTKKYAVLAMPPRRIPLPDSSPPGPRKTSLGQDISPHSHKTVFEKLRACPA